MVHGTQTSVRISGLVVSGAKSTNTDLFSLQQSFGGVFELVEKKSSPLQEEEEE